MRPATTDALHVQIAESIARHRAIARIGGPALPDPAGVARLVAAFREIAFPGFHPIPRAAEHADAAAFVDERLPMLRALLLQLVDAAISGVEEHHAPPGGGALPRLRPADAERVVDEALACIPAAREAIALDVEAAFRGDPAARSRAEIVLCYPGVAALAVHRFAHELWIRGVPVLPRMMSEHMHGATGIDIHPGARIGRGVFIDHGTGVVIGETCEIGDGCRIYQGVTLGAKKFERDADGSLRKGLKRHPTLESGVTVYAGATILGGDTVIGAGSVIAGGVFVTQSVPPGHLVASPKSQVRVLPTGEDLS
ncbi:MAG: serine O-acetyltransferase EpsC [Phycisphaerales bacterium]